MGAARIIGHASWADRAWGRLVSSGRSGLAGGGSVDGVDAPPDGISMCHCGEC